MEASKQARMITLMKEILQDDFVHMEIKSYNVTESLDEDTCRISCHLVDDNGHDMAVEGHGVGTIDAFFSGLKQRLSGEFPSLASINFSQFNIQGLISSENAVAGTEAQAEATVGIRNSEDEEFIFKATASSFSRAGLQATVEAAMYFVNSEKTFVKIHDILQHYRDEGRMDLVEKYTDLMSKVVENTSYSEVVERIKKSM